MRLRLLSGVILGMLATSLPVSAQTNPYVQKITVPEVLVRSGSSENYYATSKLRQNDKVLVLRPSTNPGWLEIKPPPGSFSWIRARFVQRKEKNIGIVVCDEETPEPIRTGSALTDKKPDVERWKLKRGTFVLILDEPFQSDGESWYPIAPTPEEVRYIPAEAVKGSTKESMPENSPATAATLIAQANAALQGQSLATAKQLYHQAAAQTQNYHEQIYCQQKINQIDDLNKSGSSLLQPGHPQYLASKNNVAPVQFATQTKTYYPTPPATLAPGAIPNSLVTGKTEWSSWGKLRRTNFFYNGQRMYSLVDSKDRTLIYAVTTPNLTLENYVGRIMCLYGTYGYRSDAYLRAHYMNVAYVAFPENAKK